MKKLDGKDEGLREVILEQAAKLFRIFGFKKLVMEDIARAVGRGRTTIYIYFKDKEAIFNAIVENEIRTYISVLTKDLANHTTAADKLGAYFKIKFDFRYAKATEYLTMNKEMRHHPEMVNKMRVFSDPPEIAHISKIIRDGIANGEFRPMTEEGIMLTTNLFISALHGISNDLLADVETLDVVPVRELLSKMFVEGLKKLDSH